MPLHLDNFDNSERPQFDYNQQLVGLERFIKTLEKHLYADVLVRNVPGDDCSVQLFIEVHCNFSFSEVVSNISEGHWGTDLCTENSSIFAEAFEVLQDQNTTLLDIDEFTIALNDTSIIINKIYELSIPEQLDNIIKEFSKNYRQITQDRQEMPFEIFVPVFEETISEKESNFIGLKTDNNQVDYFTYWGLYFHSQEDAVMYDLDGKSLVYGDLYMLNQ